VPAHLTLFHQLPPSMEGELGRRLAMATATPRPAAAVAGILDLGGGTAFRVESEELAAIREALADAFHGVLTPQDQAPWRPHVTIQNKVEAKEARALQQRLGVGFVPRPLAIRGLAAWRYLGGPWERLREWPFRL
jgi:predicted transcriptional regulator